MTAETPYPVWVVLLLGMCLLFMSLCGMMMYDLVRNMWSWNGPMTGQQHDHGRDYGFVRLAALSCGRRRCTGHRNPPPPEMRSDDSTVTIERSANHRTQRRQINLIKCADSKGVESWASLVNSRFLPRWAWRRCCRAASGVLRGSYRRRRCRAASSPSRTRPNCKRSRISKRIIARSKTS